MEAKDTIMTDIELEKVLENSIVPQVMTGFGHPKRHSPRKLIAEAQAEISFKAGLEEGRKVCPTIEVQGTIYRCGKQSGIKEVVNWIKLHWISKSSHGEGTYEFLISEWQSKLKSWGIE